MDNEWSMDFAFPLLSLLRTNGSIEAAKEKARKICEDNDMLDMCLRGCQYSLEQKILRLGLEPWNQLCRRFDVLIGEFQCWRSNIDTLTLGCYLESHNLRQSMETLTHNHSVLVVDAICRDMNTLSSCSIEEYTKFCGHVTRMLLVRLFQSSRKSIIGMLKVKWPVLPDECSQLVQFYEEEEQLALSHAPSTSSLTYLYFNIVLFYLAILHFSYQ
uniref:Uncharacterized protein n=1 Tax=Panagrolaimus sp. ES5 TaxID=591445 RepID=A0AC34F7Z1_9BILA